VNQITAQPAIMYICTTLQHAVTSNSREHC